MGFGALFFGFNGRIGRKTYWLGHIGIFIVAIAAIAALAAAVGDRFQAIAPGDEITIFALPAGALVFVLAVEVILTIASLALTVKRLHDRNRTGWLALVFYVPSWLHNILAESPPFGPAFWLTSMVAAVASLAALWFLIELGFFRGTRGPNRFGEDPVGI